MVTFPTLTELSFPLHVFQCDMAHLSIHARLRLYFSCYCTVLCSAALSLAYRSELNHCATMICTDEAPTTRDAGIEGAGRASYANRAAMFFRVAALLKRYADVYQLAVVCVNQVSDVMTAPDGTAKAPVNPRYPTPIPNALLSSRAATCTPFHRARLQGP